MKISANGKTFAYVDGSIESGKISGRGHRGGLVVFEKTDGQWMLTRMLAMGRMRRTECKCLSEDPVIEP